MKAPASTRELDERREYEREREYQATIDGALDELLQRHLARWAYAVELLLCIMAEVTRAWAERLRDDTSIRFALLELK